MQWAAARSGGRRDRNVSEPMVGRRAYVSESDRAVDVVGVTRNVANKQPDALRKQRGV
jgi:hypothetical protein